MDEIFDPGQFRGPADEVVDGTGQFAQAGRTRPVIAQTAVPGQLDELFARVALQRERVRHSGDGPVLGPFASAALHVRQRSGTDP